MPDFFFENNECGIGDQVEKIDFDFVLDCDITPAPPPLFECPLPTVTRDIEIPCPEFDVRAALSVGFVGGSGGGGSSNDDEDEENTCATGGSSIAFTITPREEEICGTSNTCAFDVDLAINVPIPLIPCPEIIIDEFEVNSHFVGDSGDACGKENKFVITTKHTAPEDCEDPGQCEFEIDLVIDVPIPRVPCPEININEFNVKTHFASCPAEENKFVIITKHTPPQDCQDPGKCEFEIDLVIDIPLPEIPCPTITVDKFEVSSGSAECPGGDNFFRIITKHTPATCDEPAKCEFGIELEIFVPIPTPPCPELNVKNFSVRYVNSLASAAGCNRFVITSKTENEGCDENGAVKSKCTFDFDLQICIPVFCPVFFITEFKVEVDYADCLSNATNIFEIRRRSLDRCEFDIDLVINVPIPRPPCPIFNTRFRAGYFVGGPYCPPPFGGRGCTSSFDIIALEQPAGCGSTTACEFLVDLNICITIPRFIESLQFIDAEVDFKLFWCPAGAGGAGQPPLLNIVELDFVKQVDQWVGSCDRGAWAEYKPKLKIQQIIPRWPCSYIKFDPEAEKEFEIARGNKEKFAVSITPQPGADDCRPCEWKFDFDLQLCTYEFTHSIADSEVNPCRYTSYSEFENCNPEKSEWLQITVEQVEGDPCKYKITTYSKPPLYVPCQEIKYTRKPENDTYDPKLFDTVDACRDATHLDVFIEQNPNDPCEFFVWVDFKYGILSRICEGDVYVNNGDLGTGTLSCEGEGAAQKYRIDIELNTTTCDETGSPGSPMRMAPFTAAPKTKKILVVTDAQIIDGNLVLVKEEVEIIDHSDDAALSTTQR